MLGHLVQMMVIKGTGTHHVSLMSVSSKLAGYEYTLTCHTVIGLTIMWVPNWLHGGVHVMGNTDWLL